VIVSAIKGETAASSAAISPGSKFRGSVPRDDAAMGCVPPLLPRAAGIRVKISVKISIAEINRCLFVCPCFMYSSFLSCVNS